MAVCWVILRGQQMYIVIQAVHSLLYIVEKWHFFSVVTWKYIIKYLQKCAYFLCLFMKTITTDHHWLIMPKMTFCWIEKSVTTLHWGGSVGTLEASRGMETVQVASRAVLVALRWPWRIRGLGRPWRIRGLRGPWRIRVLRRAWQIRGFRRP